MSKTCESLNVNKSCDAAQRIVKFKTLARDKMGLKDLGEVRS